MFEIVYLYNQNNTLYLITKFIRYSFYGAFSSLVVSKLFNSQYFHIIIFTSQLLRRCFLKNIQMVSLHNNPNKWLCYWNIRIWKLFVWRLLKEFRNQQTFSWQKTSIDWLKSKAFIVIVFFYSCEKNGDTLCLDHPQKFLYYKWLTF